MSDTRAVQPELAALAALGAKHREIAALRTLYEEQLDHCAGVIAKQDGLVEAMRAKCEKIARKIAGQYCHLVAAGEMTDAIADAIAALSPPSASEHSASVVGSPDAWRG